MTVRNLMLVLDDLLLVDGAGIREMLQRVDKKVLTMALKRISEEVAESHFQEHVSARHRDDGQNLAGHRPEHRPRNYVRISK